VVGSSMGGIVAAEAAIGQPDRVEKLVLVSAASVSSARLRRQPTQVAARMMAAATSTPDQAFRRRRAVA
jgi:pimeloyl-ACP methyl ester carboxylesterase